MPPATATNETQPISPVVHSVITTDEVASRLARLAKVTSGSLPRAPRSRGILDMPMAAPDKRIKKVKNREGATVERVPTCEDANQHYNYRWASPEQLKTSSEFAGTCGAVHRDNEFGKNILPEEFGEDGFIHRRGVILVAERRDYADAKQQEMTDDTMGQVLQRFPKSMGGTGEFAPGVKSRSNVGSEEITIPGGDV